MTNPHLATPPRDWPADARLTVESRVAVIGLHGRGQSADLIEELRRRTGSPLRWTAPSAAGGEWYPFRFMAPRPSDDPWLPDALSAIDESVRALGDEGYPPDRILLVGFSQGGCLAAHWALTRAVPLAGLAVLTGGYIGPETEPPPDGGRLDGLPVLITTRQDDPWVPIDRVRATEAAFRSRGAAVTALFEPAGDHAVSDPSIAALGRLLGGLSGEWSPSDARR